MNNYFNGMQPYPMFGSSNLSNNLIRVTGIEGAKAYQMPPNSSVALFDNNEDLFYVKSTDGAGFPTIRTFKFEEMQNSFKAQENNVDTSQFVTRKDMEDYVKFIIQSANNADSTPSKSPTNSND